MKYEDKGNNRDGEQGARNNGVRVNADETGITVSVFFEEIREEFFGEEEEKKQIFCTVQLHLHLHVFLLFP